jgi:hypothetical protein
VARVAERSFGPGPHELLLVDPAVEEVMVNLRRGRCGSSAPSPGAHALLL